MQIKIYLTSIIFLFLGLNSCTNNPLDINVSDVDLTLEVKSFEKDLFSTKSSLSNDEVEKLAVNYQPFFDDFTNEIINILILK